MVQINHTVIVSVVEFLMLPIQHKGHFLKDIGTKLVLTDRKVHIYKKENSLLFLNLLLSPLIHIARQYFISSNFQVRNYLVGIVLYFLICTINSISQENMGATFAKLDEN